jgi:hypothetical protein
MFSSVTSVIALFVSITVAYLTLFRRGKRVSTTAHTTNDRGTPLPVRGEKAA